LVSTCEAKTTIGIVTDCPFDKVTEDPIAIQVDIFNEIVRCTPIWILQHVRRRVDPDARWQLAVIREGNQSADVRGTGGCTFEVLTASVQGARELVQVERLAIAQLQLA
jgi:hypothetical protein